MKKLMIAACAIALAGAVQAGQIRWANADGLAAAGCGDLTKGYSGQVYLFQGDATAAALTLATFKDKGGDAAAFATVAAGALNYATLTTYADFDEEWYQYGELSSPKDGSVSGGNVTFGEYAKDYQAAFYQIAYDDGAKAFYMSEVVTNKKVPATGSGDLKFANGAAAEGVTFKLADGYQGAGWYTAAVPEPTSGLLLLLGVAGLALRRRRA